MIVRQEKMVLPAYPSKYEVVTQLAFLNPPRSSAIPTRAVVTTGISRLDRKSTMQMLRIDQPS